MREVIRLMSVRLPAAEIFVTATPLYVPLSSVTGVSPIYIVRMSLAASPVIPDMLYAPPVVVAVQAPEQASAPFFLSTTLVSSVTKVEQASLVHTEPETELVDAPGFWKRSALSEVAPAPSTCHTRHKLLNEPS